MSEFEDENSISGLGSLERQRLSKILRNTKVVISVTEASKILDMPQSQTAKMLALYAKKGWLARIQYGFYISVPMEAADADITLTDPIAVASKLFSPCYIGGWSAAEHWGMTEQIFNSIIVITTKIFKNKSPIIKNTKYVLHATKASSCFGLSTIWSSNIKIQISDPTRTIVDLMNNPSWGGGLRFTADILQYYFKSNNKDVELLIQYMKFLNKGSAFKRLGFLTEKLCPAETLVIEICKNNLSAGNAKLDPTLECNKLITRYKLLVPKNWKENSAR